MLLQEPSEFIWTQQNCNQKEWGELFRESFDSTWRYKIFDKILGCLKRNKHSIEIHRLEKDLVYLSALSISKRRQLFFSFPVSPVSLGILLVIYYAHIAKEARDIYQINHAVSAKDFLIWIRPNDTGKILSLRTTKAFNLVDTDDTYLELNDRIKCLPAYQFNEFSKSEQLRVVTVRSLQEAIELLKQSRYCSLVILDDASGRTFVYPSAYGDKAFQLAKLCKQNKIPLIGIVPPYAMKAIEFNEINNNIEIGIWAVDFWALRSYPLDRKILKNTNNNYHPVEQSYLLLEKKRQSLGETKVTITTFNFELEDKEKIAELFQESSNLLIDLSQQIQYRRIWAKSWQIWRHLSAPVLPFYLLWEQFLADSFNFLNNEIRKTEDVKIINLYNLLFSLSMRLQKLNFNPFLEMLQQTKTDTIVAVEDAKRAKALEEFLRKNKKCSSKLEILPVSEIRQFNGNNLIVIGQLKACYRDILQTSFFIKINVFLWSVLAERAEKWWSNLEIDPRKWHQKTWQALTDKQGVGRYNFSFSPTSVQIVNVGKSKFSKSINLVQLEESFSLLNETSLDSGLTNLVFKTLESHYYVEFEQGLKIRTSHNSEFLVFTARSVQVVSVRELTVGAKVVLFDGMNRDELFAQKARLLEDTKVNYLYQVQLEAWRELVRKRVKELDLTTVCRYLFQDTSLEIGKQAIQYNWMNSDDLLSLPREREHFFWFIPQLARSNFEDFWQKANELRIKRRQLGKIISTCAQEGWQDRKPDEIVFQYQQVFITVGELREAMQILKVQLPPKLICHPPEFPFNRLFK